MFYEEVFRALNNAKVKYAVAGGVAVVLHGYVRFTADLDLIVRLEEKNIDRFFHALTKLEYRPVVPVTKEQFKVVQNRRDWIKNKGMVVFSFWHPKDPLKHIDIFVEEPIKFDLIAKNIKKVKAGNLIIPLLAIKQLIQLKEKSARDRDIIDISNLKKIQKIKKDKHA